MNKKTIRFELEYLCYPLWEIDTDGGILGNELPPEIIEESELSKELDILQQQYDDSYIDDGHEFGVKEISPADEIMIKNLAREVWEKMNDLLGDKYHLVDDVNPYI